MSPLPPKPRIDPPSENIWPGGGWTFQLFLGRNSDPNATWAVSDPNVGSINRLTGEFIAEREPYRNSMTEIIGTTSDGKQAKAEVHLIVGRGLMSSGPVFVDGIQRSAPFEPVRWNDRLGRRAAVLMTETLWQLPKEFIDSIGDVAMIRVKTLKVGNGTMQDGMHLPLGQNCVLLAEDSLISQLEDKPEITDMDRYFVEVFIHELAHVAMTRKAMSVLDRQWLGSLLDALNSSNSIWLLLSGAAAYLRYYSPLAGQDFCSEYAKVTGWVVNNPNPLSMFWNDITVLPNVVTGLKLLGQHVGLRNKNPAPIPIPFPPAPPVTPDEKDDYARRVGFASYYATTDVHEDWAEAVMSILVDRPIAKDSKFAPRRKFIEKSGVVPRSFKPVEAGSILNDWARKRGLPDPDMRQWAVYFGNYAGKFRDPQPILFEPTEATKMKASSVGRSKESASEVSNPDTGVLGEGGEVEYPSMDQFVDETQSLLMMDELGSSQEEFDQLQTEKTVVTREEVAAFEIPLREATTIEFLRTAECHGAGLIKLSLAAEADDTALDTGFPLAVGDVVCDVDQTIYVVVDVDKKGRVLKMAGTPIANETGRLPMGKPDASRLRFVWRPNRKARTWTTKNSSHGEYSDLPAAMTRMVRLWGETIGGRKQELATAGGFVAEALDAAGLKHKDILDSNSDEVSAYLDQFGAGLQARSKEKELRPQVGDLMRLQRSKLWAVCTRAAEGDEQFIDIVAQGGMKPVIGEPEDSVIVVHGFDLANVAVVWSPASQGRKH